MRWIAALLVVTVLFTLCGCHSALGIVFCAIGEWFANHGGPLTGVAGTVMVLGILLFVSVVVDSTDASAPAAGNVCQLTAQVDTDGDGIGDVDLDLQGPWALNGDHWTATLTPTQVAAAQLGAPQVDLDLRFTAENTMAGTMTYTIGGQSFSGPLTVDRF